MLADRRLPARWLLAFSLLLNWQAHAAAAEDSPSQVRIEKGRVDVTLTATEKQYKLPAKIRVSLLLRNASDQRDTARRVFPIAAPPTTRFLQADTPSCRVMVNGISVNFGKKLLIDPAERTQAWPSGKQAAAWSNRLEHWFAKDKELMNLVERYRKLASVQIEMSELTETFRKRVKRHLIHDDLDYEALTVANGGPNFHYLVRLMPEIEPAYRIDGKFQRWEYVSLLSDGDPEVYRPYEQEWREKADKWFVSKPDLILLVPKLRELWGEFREAQKLIAGPILKHLHDVNGLSLPVADHVKSFIERDSNRPPTALLRKMFPDIDTQLKKQSSFVSKRLRAHGFDESIVSPFTGKLMPESSMPMPYERTLWNDETVLAELGRPKRNSPFAQRNREPLTTPMLISFEAPLEPKSAATVVIEYDTALIPMQHPASSHLAFGSEEVMAVFPSPHDVPYSVTCPAEFHPVIAPGPRVVAGLKEGTRRFDGRLNSEQSMLHVAMVNFAKDPDSWTSRFRENDLRSQKDLQILIDKIENPSVRPLLMTALYAALLKKGEPWNAHQLFLQIRADHPDFGGLLDVLPGHLYQAREAKKLHEWVAEKAMSPHIKTEEDFKRFTEVSGYAHQMVTSAALAALADRVGRLKEDSLTLGEEMGRRFILCQAGVDPQGNLAALLKLAEANPREANSSLKLIQFLTIEKPSALPFVIRQIDLELRAKARAGTVKTDSFEWTRQNHAYYAMGTFRSPQAAKQLIEFIHSTDDSLLVQGAISALGNMTLPEHFEELTEIADRIAASSASGYIKYLDLLMRSDPERAVPFLETLRNRHPKFAGYVLRTLGRSQIPMALPKALDVYRNSKEVEGEVVSAITVISQMANPKDIAELEYRKGLPGWMNERLVSVIRSKGGDESVFPFVEAYYKEFVQGKKKQIHLTCVAAFERIGDRRAIPYLREILNTTERKRDASEALGRMLLDRQIKRERVVDNAVDLNLRVITEPNSPEEKRAAAWKELLRSPEKSFDRVMVYSAVRSALEDSRSEWDEDDAARCRFISGFGDVAAARLLKESDGCSLHERYRIAHLLTLLLPGSNEMIQKTADDESADSDRKLTAQLAQKLTAKPAIPPPGDSP
jgi:HEAT repeat protein